MAKRVPRKKRQRRNSPNHSDLYTDENPKDTIKGLKFATVKDAEASVNKIKRSGRAHNHKTQAAIAMEQRAKAAGKKSAAAVYRKFIEQQKEKTAAKNEAIANKENLYLDVPNKSRGYMSGKDVTWEGEDAQTHIYDWYKEMHLAEENLRKYIRTVLLEDKKKVLGYIKPDSAFFTLDEWEYFCNRMLQLQKQGFDTRGGGISLQREVFTLVNKYFDFQLNTEVNRYDLLTYKNVMDFIEDFVNHRFWGLEKEFGHYFPDIKKLRFAYFYSRGDIEPYALIDDEFTTQLYGSTNNPKRLLHYTTEAHAMNMLKVIEAGENNYDISSFTVAERPFFRKSSDYIIEFVGNVRAGFRSDIKSFATSSGRRAVNLYRLEYPGDDLNNICYELDTCDGTVRTSLWNEYIATPLQVINIRTINPNTEKRL
tara:strand:+ start:953 stop:2224 length:1272 start_codon:yes stop_codon:yes gene_type:complete